MPQTDVVPMNALSLSAAQRVAEAAISAARSKDIDACIAVCDPSGAAIVTIRMDGAPRLSAEVALNKVSPLGRDSGTERSGFAPGEPAWARFRN